MNGSEDEQPIEVTPTPTTPTKIYVEVKTEAEIVTKYRPYVIKQARRFAGKGVEIEDLIQIGLFAVVRAFRVWKPDGGASMLTWIRMPVRSSMMQEIDRVTKQASEKDLRLDDQYCDDHSLRMTNHEVIGSYEDPGDVMEDARIKKIVGAMDNRLQTVLRMRREGFTLVEIGTHFGFSRERARQLEAIARDEIARKLGTKIS